MNTFLQNLKEQNNFKLTENGAISHASTMNMVYDLFSLGAAYRSRSDADCILLFKNAFEADPLTALKCLFYIADCRGGQGERRYFRVCFNWLCKNYPEVAAKNLAIVPEYRRWDDLIYSTIGTPMQDQALAIIKEQLNLDITCKAPSLLGKWMPSENASSKETKRVANIVRTALGLTHKEYRKVLTELRKRINVLERLMSQNRWEEIEFDKIPSKAGLIYKNAFARRDIIATKYENFAKDKTTKVNASTLYPYDVVEKAIDCGNRYRWNRDTDVDRAMIEKYWKNLPDYFDGKECSLMCVVDTSGSMHGRPINVAISLGMYCAERLNGPFKDHYISFASRPQLIKVEGVDFVDKVDRIYRTNLIDNTNLTAVFDLLKRTALQSDVNAADVPNTIVVISDMEIDQGASACSWNNYKSFTSWTRNTAQTEMEKVRADWAAAGLKLPRLVYWNVNARNDTILDLGPDVTYVSGCSPVIFQQVVTGKTGIDLMMDKLNTERYDAVTV